MFFTRSDRERLARIEGQLARLIQTEGVQTMTVTELLDQVRAQTTVVESVQTAVSSAVGLLGELKAALDEALATGDPAALQAISDQLAAHQATLAAEATALAEAVVANTPGQGTP